MEKLLCPSMMCADFASLKTEIENLEKGGIDIFHLDVMDGSFVPNFGMGLQDIEYICKTATKPHEKSSRILYACHGCRHRNSHLLFQIRYCARRLSHTHGNLRPAGILSSGSG